MNKIVIIMVVAMSFWACGTEEAKTDEHATNSAVTEEQHHESQPEHNLALNNGAKWKADESTNSNVQNLMNVVEKFDSSGEKNLDGYLSVGAELQLGVEELIKGCRMQGPDHDALHVWLEPLMGQIRDLGESTSMDQAERMYGLVVNQVKLYPQYFE